MTTMTCLRNSSAAALAQSRRSFLAACAAFAVSGSIAAAHAQGWPHKPVRVIVPFPPGGLTDGIARLLGERLSGSLKQPFVIENMAGAAGVIAARTAAGAPPDGHTLFMGSLVQVAVLPAMSDVAYDPLRDFAPISNLASTPFVLMIHSNVPARTLTEFVDYVRKQPGKFTYASSGAGSLDHLSMTLLCKRAGIEMVHVPYKGGPQAITDLISGQVTTYFGPRPLAVAQANSGKVKLLAISDEKRSAQLPDVPTVIESGYPGFRTVTWNGLIAPARTARSIIEKIAGEVQRAIKDEAFIRTLLNFGVDPIGDTPQEFAATIAADISVWAGAVKVAGIAN